MRPRAPNSTVVILGLRVLGLLLDRPPDQVDERCKRNLQRQHQPQESPGHDGADGTPKGAACHERTSAPGGRVRAGGLGEGGEGWALKRCYAAGTKGTAALLLAIRAQARASGVEDALGAEWARSQPDLAGRCDGAVGTAGRAWRYAGEMEEIAAAFAADGPERCSGLPVVRYDSSSLGQTLGRGFQLVDSRQHTHATPWGSDQSFQFSVFRHEASTAPT